MTDRIDQLMKQFYATEQGFGVEEISYTQIEKFKKSVMNPEESNPWETLRAKALACTACALSKDRKKVVFGEGNIHADLMFVGGAPGQEEDEAGRPFIGEAGQLLTKIIQAMNLKRDDVYITHCVKCHPVDDRNPSSDEVASCDPFLARQIQLVQPKIICALGKFSTQILLQTEVSIAELRGKFTDYLGIKIMPTFDPSHLLKNPSDKILVWQDMQAILHELGLPIPQPGK